MSWIMIQRIDISLMMTLGWMTVKSSMSSWIRNFPKIETLYSPSGYLEPHKSKSLDSFWTPKIISVYIWLIMHDVKDDITALHSRISLQGDDDDVGLVHPSNIIKKTETKISLCLEPRAFCPKGWLITICSLNGHLKLYKIESLDSFWVPKTVRFLPPKRWVIAKIQPKSCQILPKSLWSHGQNTLFCERLQFISAWGSKRKQRPTTTSSIFTIDFFYLWKNYSQNIRLMLEWQLYIIFLLTLENN